MIVRGVPRAFSLNGKLGYHDPVWGDDGSAGGGNVPPAVVVTPESNTPLIVGMLILLYLLSKG